MINSFLVGLLFSALGVIPIYTLTDAPMRRWRFQAALVTARRGIVVTLMSPKDLIRHFPHKRIFGPFLMPFSKETAQELRALNSVGTKNKIDEVCFIGSLYEPRTSILNEINQGLKAVDVNFNFSGRQLGTAKLKESEYWETLSKYKFVVTTADQVFTNETDHCEIPHLIYRYLEAPAAGAILVAQVVPGIERYFIPDIHFVSYKTPNEAVEKIQYLLQNHDQAEQLRQRGYQLAQSLIEVNSFWATVDACLGRNPITR